MPATIVIGSQWGDEGKGKLVDYLSQSANMIMRYQGGDNAGHTIINQNHTFHLQLIPSGIFNPKTTNLLGNGTVINPQTLLNEIKTLKAHDIDPKKLVISNRAHVIMPYHQLLDQLQEQSKSATNKIGTTQKGIGPAYMDKIERIGLRMADLIDPNQLAQRLKATLKIKNQLLTKLYGHAPLDYQTLYEQYKAYGQQLKPYVKDTSLILANSLQKKQKIVLEGAQGVMLDLDQGTYPYVTSSNPIPGGALSGSGLAPQAVQNILGVCKAYTSRVGAGPFPTELHNQIGQHIQTVGHEFGTVTKRPRRVGWLDSVALRHAQRVSGFTELAVNCLDVLDDLKEIKIATGYELDGHKIEAYPANLANLDQVKVIYETLPGWQTSTKAITSFHDLPKNAQIYLKEIERLTDVPISYFSVGPKQNQTHHIQPAATFK